MLLKSVDRAFLLLLLLLTKLFSFYLILCSYTGGPLYVVVFANDQLSAPYKTKDTNGDGILEDDGESLSYKRPQITANNYVSNDDTNFPPYFISTDGADPAISISAMNTALGHPGRNVDVMIEVCGDACVEENDSGEDSDDSSDDGPASDTAAEKCCYVATESADADASEDSEVKQAELTYRVPPLTSVRDVTQRASVNFTLQVSVISTKYGEIGTSEPEPFHRGLIFYKLPVSDEYVDVVFEGDKALIIMSGNNFGGHQVRMMFVLVCCCVVVLLFRCCFCFFFN